MYKFKKNQITVINTNMLAFQMEKLKMFLYIKLSFHPCEKCNCISISQMGKATEKEKVIYSISESAKIRRQKSWFPGLQSKHLNSLFLPAQEIFPSLKMLFKDSEDVPNSRRVLLQTGKHLLPSQALPKNNMHRSKESDCNTTVQNPCWSKFLVLYEYQMVLI